ncbi:MAG: TonB-dependent receptor [bacterium]
MHLVSSFLIAVAIAGAAAQQPAFGGTINGSVIDATTATPLAGALVTLAPANGFGVLLDTPGTSSLTLARTVTTSAAGKYRFTDLPIGAFRLRIQRMGYEPATIDVRLGDAGTPALSIGLVVLPVRLRPVEVRAHDSHSSLNDGTNTLGEDPRLAAVRTRQAAFLSTDARELTLQDVAESATLGGSDVLRSLQRLPGVAPFDDWSAKLWVRGNRWDHNRLYFDGVPLFDPLGVLGRTSGVSTAAIGGAFLHPGVRPVSLGGEGATQIDVQSRPASGNGAWRGSAELSQFGAGASVERARSDNSAGFLVTAQQSLGHWLPRDGAFSEALSERSYRDAQATVRGDLDLGGGRRLATSGLVTRDARIGVSQFGSDATNQEWANALGRVTFTTPLGPFAMANTLGASSFESSSNRWITVPAAGATPTLSPVTSNVDYLTFGGRVAARLPTDNVTTFGYDVIAQRTSIQGTHKSPGEDDLALAVAARADALTYGSLWAERRSALGDRITIESGLRLDAGGSHGLDAVRPAGSMQALLALSPNTRVSGGVSRVHQYVQGIDAPALGQGQTLPTSWLVSGGDVPVMSIDNVMAGVEQWVSTGVLVAANVYARRTTGAIADDPTPGSLFQRPLFVNASEVARGAEVSARKLTGPATAIVAYSYGNGTMHASGLSFPSPATRTHAFDAVMSIHLGSVNLGSAYMLTSGAPFTRMVDSPAPGSSGAVLPTVREAPNAQRLPAYSSLDVSIDYTRVIRNVRLIAFAGAQNMLGRSNATWYEVSGYCENGSRPPVASAQCRDHDVFDAPVKLVPTIGLRLVVR